MISLQLKYNAFLPPQWNKGKPMLIMLYMSSIFLFIPKGLNIMQIWK